MSESIAVPSVWSPDQVLAVAHKDAVRVYRDIDQYRLSMVYESDGWHVDYEPKNPLAFGGGPHYVIDAETGAILHRRYEQ